jgi:hypothetical protein
LTFSVSKLDEAHQFITPSDLVGYRFGYSPNQGRWPVSSQVTIQFGEPGFLTGRLIPGLACQR